MTFDALFFKRIDDAPEDFHPPFIISQYVGDRQHPFKHSPREPPVTIHIIYQFFVVFLKEKMPIDFLVVLIGFFVIFASFFKQTETTFKLIFFNDTDEFRHSIVVILHVANELVVDPLLVFIFT